MPDFMRAVTFRTDLFSGEATRERSEKALTLFLRTLLTLDVDFLGQYPRTPSVYDSRVNGRVRYVSEPWGYESWKSIPVVMKDGFGDCEDLACWRAAELRVRGINAEPFFTKRQSGRSILYHILVRLPDGSVEDPSRRLGMR